ncbi:hypothetical protein [Gordonia sp. OPL2]|uniref:hypothetical protein n=1 Tax=Gordonia sp. OPL2 TaxID=2486274 RepID=UPI0021CCA28E|nr:hypothetical protein [Gordonia sp. OPL2]
MLRTKLAAVVSGNPPPPIMRVTLADVAVGHSAHVSARGYIPAAPFRSDGASLSTVGAWLTDDEAAALDHTEPNYDRMMLSTADHPVVAAPVVPLTFSLYVSRHGVLTDPRSGHRVPLGPQRTVVAWLDAELADRTLSGPVDDVCRRLAVPRHGARVSAAMRSAGLASGCGIGTVPAEGAARQ